MTATNANAPRPAGEGAGKGTKKEKRKNYDRDGLWKDLIGRFFYPLLKRALPELYEAADTGREQKLLDKEFRDILNTADPEIRTSPHFADYVLEVPLKNGNAEWVLLHIEAQGQKGGNFPERMNHYRSLIYAHYRKEPVALAIITDRRPGNEAPHYSHSHFGTEIIYRYNNLVLADVRDEELQASGNPADLALYAAKCSLKAKRELQKYNYLRTLTGILAERGWGMDDKRDLLLFLERIMALKDKELRMQYREYQEQLDREGKIVYVSVAEEYYTAKGIEKGIEKGIAKGIEKGREQMAKKLLARGDYSPEVISEIADLPVERVRALTD
ncbi:MAG: hypothetical protein LBU26_06655 [Synergistaceae bacterium]|jgi:hypothetical protein|nr:hypothetical protein [Synergistaceae bacterium]